MIGVIVSTKIEWDEIIKEYNIQENMIEKYPYGEYFETKFYDKDILFFRTLGRKSMAAASTQYMIDNKNLKKVINIGSATAVEDYVDYQDVFIPNKVAEYDLTIRELEPLIKESNILKLDKVDVTSKYFDGLLGTSDKSLVTYKDYLMTKETDMVASDTEGAAIARVCLLNNVKIVIIKGITDRPINKEGYEEQFDVYEENAPIAIKNIIENYLPEVI